MQFYRCKCGNARSWTTMGVSACSRCSKCGSDLAQGPSEHEDPKPHEYVKRYSQITGEPYDVCRLCLEKRADLEPPTIDGVPGVPPVGAP